MLAELTRTRARLRARVGSPSRHAERKTRVERHIRRGRSTLSFQRRNRFQSRASPGVALPESPRSCFRAKACFSCAWRDSHNSIHADDSRRSAGRPLRNRSDRQIAAGTIRNSDDREGRQRRRRGCISRHADQHEFHSYRRRSVARPNASYRVARRRTPANRSERFRRRRVARCRTSEAKLRPIPARRRPRPAVRRRRSRFCSTTCGKQEQLLLSTLTVTLPARAEPFAVTGAPAPRHARRRDRFDSALTARGEHQGSRSARATLCGSAAISRDRRSPNRRSC